MLKKNVYIFYPAGYHGNYLKWAIEVSDLDSRGRTPLDPVPKSQSLQYGGAGTSHLNHRIPTHQSIQLHTIWSLLNKPKEPLIYLINSGEGRTSQYEIAHFISTLLYSDPTGVVVSIHDNNDPMVMSYGRINCVTKWPTFIPATMAIKKDFPRTPRLHDTFDFKNCQHDQEFRNWLVKNDFIGTKPIIDPVILKQNFDGLARWYQVRNELQPHEVNTDTYLPGANAVNRVFEISCLDIATQAFPAWLEHFMQTGAPSDNFDCAHVQEFQHTYSQAQPNLRWFEAMQHWNRTGELDAYLTSHSVIQAEVIREIFRLSNVGFASQQQQSDWYIFYSKVRDDAWPKASFDPDDFWILPMHIQQELVEDFGYQPKFTGPPNPVIKTLDWENMSLEDINKIYQQAKT